MLIKNDHKRLRNVHGLKRIKYCLGNGLELFSASVVMAVCHDSRVLRTRQSTLSITAAFLKSIECLFDQAWLEMLSFGTVLDIPDMFFFFELKNISPFH